MAPRKFRTERAFSDWLAKEEFPTIPNSFFWKKHAADTRRGFPDWIGCVNGYFVALELKLDGRAKDDSREKLQRYYIEVFRGAGAKVALDRVTPGGWGSVKKKLLKLSAACPTRPA